MNRLRVLIPGILAVASWGFVPVVQAQYCHFPPNDVTKGPRREYRGPYENKAYSYSVVIPSSLVGYDGANPLYQHGFGIALGSEPQSYVFVNGEPNSLEFTRPTDAATQFLEYLRKHGNKVESSKITESHLDGLKAALLIATYTCPGTNDRYMTASEIAISPDKSNLYEITLYARSDRFEQDRAVLDALVHSWKHLGE